MKPHHPQGTTRAMITVAYPNAAEPQPNNAQRSTGIPFTTRPLTNPALQTGDFADKKLMPNKRGDHQ